jgi:hypothetical protein
MSEAIVSTAACVSSGCLTVFFIAGILSGDGAVEQGFRDPFDRLRALSEVERQGSGKRLSNSASGTNAFLIGLTGFNGSKF